MHFTDGDCLNKQRHTVEKGGSMLELGQKPGGYVLPSRKNKENKKKVF
jgi:hypothetical protein